MVRGHLHYGQVTKQQKWWSKFPDLGLLTVAWLPRPNPRKGLGITLLRSVLLECHGFWIQKLPFQIFNVIGQVLLLWLKLLCLLYIRFLSLVELERWLAEVIVPPSSTLMTAFQCWKCFVARFFPDSSSHGQNVWRPDYLNCARSTAK